MTKEGVLFSITYIAMVNIIAFLLYAEDKKRARKKQYRITEGTLIMVAAVGGSVGAMFGMIINHHKIRKPLFYLGIPFIMALQGYVIYLCYLN